LAPSGDVPFGLVDQLLSSNRTYRNRFTVKRPLLAARIGYVIKTVATTNDPVDVALYNVATNARLATAGSTLAKLNVTAGTGFQSVNFVTPVLLQPGVVYGAALWCTTTGTAATLSGTGFSGLSGDIFGTTQTYKMLEFQAGQVPDPFVTGGSIGGAPWLSVLEA
jgi:hypothetical protein